MTTTIEPPARDEPLLSVRHLVQRFRLPRATLEAVSDISFDVARGEVLGLVGESGCGKSTTGRAILQLPPPTSGTVHFAGSEITGMPRGEFRKVRLRMQMIFQDPASALNPRRKVRNIVAEGLVISGEKKETLDERVEEVLDLVGLDMEVVGDRRPHELSGGQCQRVAIARALVLRPQLIVCDEPVASLDVSIQGQVLNLLEDMRTRFGLSMVFISHDLSVVYNVSDRIVVMYLGKIVELGSSNAVTRRPAHPYSRALLDAVPVADPEAPLTKSALPGEIPSPIAPPSGCRFRTRCVLAQARCADEIPILRDIGEGQWVACHFPLHGKVADASQSQPVATAT
jgi:peptide/nickel transport system ATP-binding protein